MGDSPMVIVWPTRDEDGYFDEVILSQRKAPYQTMPTPDKNPPLTAELLLSNMSVRPTSPIRFLLPSLPDSCFPYSSTRRNLR